MPLRRLVGFRWDDYLAEIGMTIIKTGVVSQKYAIAAAGRLSGDDYLAEIGMTIIKTGVVSEKYANPQSAIPNLQSPIRAST